MKQMEFTYRQAATAFLLRMRDPLLGETFGCDLYLSSDDATLEDFMGALDGLAALVLSDCKGCDSCCQERAPLIAADIPRLAKLLPESPWPAHAVCSAFADVTVADGVTDITFRRPNGACIHLDPATRSCVHWQQRAFVCRSHFCLPRSQRIHDLRQEIVNAGENELTRLLLAEESLGAPPITPQPLSALVSPADYEDNPLRGYLDYDQIRLRDALSPELWHALRTK